MLKSIEQLEHDKLNNSLKDILFCFNENNN